MHACCVAFYRHQDIINARFGTMVAAMYNSQRTDRKQKWLEWYDIFTPYSAQSKPKAPSLADIRKQFIEAQRKRG